MEPIEIVRDRLYYVATNQPQGSTHPSSLTNKNRNHGLLLGGNGINGTTNDVEHWFTMDDSLAYYPFFLDFGPLSLGCLYRFCQTMSTKLTDKSLSGKRIIYYSGQQMHRRANSIYLLAAYTMLYLGKTPEEAIRPFQSISPVVAPWHDASPTLDSFHLTTLDVLRGIHKACLCNFFSFDAFDLYEYETYEKVENGDMNWLVDGRFLAFAGPHDARMNLAAGYHTTAVDDIIPYFRSKGISAVIRLNKKYYNERRFITMGIAHYDMYYLDGSNPPEPILQKFLQTCENTTGAIAVHCKAGLGRTGTCIGAYIMKHYRFTAREVIGWMRVCRPGSVIGPQQQFLEEIQSRMWDEGEVFRKTRELPLPAANSLLLTIAAANKASNTSGNLTSRSQATSHSSRDNSGTESSASASSSSSNTVTYSTTNNTLVGNTSGNRSSNIARVVNSTTSSTNNVDPVGRAIGRVLTSPITVGSTSSSSYPHNHSTGYYSSYNNSSSLNNNNSSLSRGLAAITSRMDALGLGEPSTGNDSSHTGGRDSLDAERDLHASINNSRSRTSNELLSSPDANSRTKSRGLGVVDSLSSSTSSRINLITSPSSSINNNSNNPSGTILSRAFAGYERALATTNPVNVNSSLSAAALSGSQGDALRSAKAVRTSPLPSPTLNTSSSSKSLANSTSPMLASSTMPPGRSTTLPYSSSSSRPSFGTSSLVGRR